jgi:hypothetical protein
VTAALSLVAPSITDGLADAGIRCRAVSSSLSMRASLRRSSIRAIRCRVQAVVAVRRWGRLAHV